MNPTLNSHTHCQAAQSQRTIQSLSKSVSEPTHRQERKSTIAQHCIRAIAGEVVKSRSVQLINFCVGGQVIALKSATALILDRCRSPRRATGLKSNAANNFTPLWKTSMISELTALTLSNIMVTFGQ